MMSLKNHRNVSDRETLFFLNELFNVQMSIDSKHDFALSFFAPSSFKVCSALAPKIYYNLKAFRVCFLLLEVLEIPPSMFSAVLSRFFFHISLCILRRAR